MTERWWEFKSPPSIPGTHDKSKCLEKGEPDEDCCALRQDVSCADGYQLKFTGKKCGDWKVPWVIIECLKPGGTPKDEKKNTKDAVKAKKTQTGPPTKPCKGRTEEHQGRSKGKSSSFLFIPSTQTMGPS